MGRDLQPLVPVAPGEVWRVPGVYDDLDAVDRTIASHGFRPVHRSRERGMWQLAVFLKADGSGTDVAEESAELVVG